MPNALKTTALVLFLGGCGYVDAYEEAVYDHEPVYCYQTLAAVQCFKEPQHSDKQRLVNYYGPHPSRADEPEPPEVPELQPPTQSTSKWVKDPEPVPQPRVRVGGVLRTVGFGKPLPNVGKPKLDEETATELRSMKITEPVAPSKSTTTTVELDEK